MNKNGGSVICYKIAKRKQSLQCKMCFARVIFFFPYSIFIVLCNLQVSLNKRERFICTKFSVQSSVNVHKQLCFVTTTFFLFRAKRFSCILQDVKWLQHGSEQHQIAPGVSKTKQFKLKKKNIMKITGMLNQRNNTCPPLSLNSQKTSAKIRIFLLK